MKMTEIIDDRLLEQLQYGYIPDISVGLTKMVARRRLKSSKVMPSNKAGASKNTHAVANKPFRKPIDSINQVTGLNPEIDVTKGTNFKLDNYNIRPEMTDIDRKIYDNDAIHFSGVTNKH